MKHIKDYKKLNKPKRKKKFHRPEWFTPAYQSLLRKVKLRDSNSCQMPGCKKKRFGMECHHIIPWNMNVALRYSPENCIMLCSKCHEKITGHEAVYASLFFSIVRVNTINEGR